MCGNCCICGRRTWWWLAANGWWLLVFVVNKESQGSTFGGLLHESVFNLKSAFLRMFVSCAFGHNARIALVCRRYRMWSRISTWVFWVVHSVAQILSKPVDWLLGAARLLCNLQKFPPWISSADLLVTSVVFIGWISGFGCDYTLHLVHLQINISICF